MIDGCATCSDLASCRNRSRAAGQLAASERRIRIVTGEPSARCDPRNTSLPSRPRPSDSPISYVAARPELEAGRVEGPTAATSPAASAAPSSAIVCQRSAGAFASPRATASSSHGGTSGRTLRSRGAVRVRCAVTISSVSVSSNGTRPVIISNITMHRL